MPLDPTLITGIIGILKLLFIAFAVAYFLFSLFVIRQVNLMTETVQTEGGPILKAIAILHAGLALGIIILFIGFL
ncbi:MAG: hypothetical protein ACD_30C00013G0004 [uncultured bacterium]|uniref:DUF350 domain-containing protein n=3 Tax=Candidatus Daviesiibacteriota TaxID=1752718 RepID=A0A0G0ETK5_9BACT|nr:MAG: hypothetical protein ACD_30C00013G0004 [uncultured bacterium]KKQ08897.1 MAG: hypothetical protein US19_C0018G0014 [Candidatus Daviesbacteria bacterium GW2011_GWB1_36_5]KKQ14165.1 MAG: hypothetical protein US28_C0038G0001 [Candidatus Daviesbacteria bacterium GW2011_GWA1_36_8]OGE32772.1 MAG: hypothetical protein A3C99_03615 [Candidatus Daviesbacteria bacterium RIFCSPHIGHO2_02_FULL_37_9]OGE34886.1 MAG: hypothetical protein A3E66_04745 [Candidatus Daviesbacteria bacterium RIFCSPHIGHO2_12_FU